jgi:glycosyltransferase involved in cell wall biosynthesis
MRIALFHNTPSGGAKRSIYEWVKRLSLRHEIDVFTLSTADHSFCDIRPFAHSHVMVDFIPRKLFRSPLGRLNQFQRWLDLGDLSRIGKLIADKINQGHYDVIFANNCLFTFIPTFLQYVDRPSVFYLHEPFGQGFSRPIQRPFLQQSGYRKLIDRVDPLIRLYLGGMRALQDASVRRTKLLLANSLFTREQMRRNFGLDTPVCHYGVNTNNFYPMTGVEKEDFVLSVGELSPRKGFDFLVQSIGRISSNMHPKLVLACNNVDALEKTYIETLAVQKGVQLQIQTHLSTDELAILYNKACICVYSPVLEPFGLVPLEAMSCGTPVVGVREGGVQESIVHEHTGLLVDRDPDQFAAAIQHLLSNPELAAEYGRMGRKHVLHNWTWENSVSSLEKYLVECSNNTVRNYPGSDS